MLATGILKYLSLLERVIIQRKTGAISTTFAVLNVIGYGIGAYVSWSTAMLPYFISLFVVTLTLLISLIIRKRQKEKFLSADSTYQLVLDYFETEEAAEAWWVTPNKYLGGASPEKLVASGHNGVVRRYIGRLAHGIPS